jgi:hypothetical protein
MKRFTLVLSVLAILLTGTFSIASGARTHYIRYGDTLWDLSMQYYDNPFYWDKILSANPGVEVRYLQPGTELIIPDIFGEMAIVDQGTLYAGGIYTTSSSSSRPLISRLVLETAGMVTDTPLQPSGYVIDTDLEEEDPFEDINSYPGDLLAIDIGWDDGVQPDMVYKLYKHGEAVRHPVTGALLGDVYRVSGVCRVVDTDQGSSVALLEHSYIPVTYGDMLVPYNAASPIPVASSETVEDLDAYVLAFQDAEMERIYSYDVAYIDRGSSDGLRPGDIYCMYKYGEQVMDPAGGTEVTPDVQVAELIVLNTTDDTAAVMVFSVSTSDLVRIGDRIELIRRQL